MATAAVERKSRRQSFRRERILDHAEAILSKKGIEGLKITEIAEACDLTHSNLYYYFKDVTSIYDEICVRLVKKEVDLMLGILTDDPRSVVAVFEGRTRYYFSHPDLFWLLYQRTQKMSLETLKTGVYPQSIRISAKIEQVLNQGKKDGRVKKAVQSRKLSNLIVLTSNGILATYLGMKRVGGGLKFDAEEIIGEASRVFRDSTYI